MPKGKKKQSEETKPSSEPDSDMAQVLELSNRGFKIALIDVLRALMETVDNTQKLMGNITEMETLKKYQKEILDIQTEMKNSFDGLISGLNTGNERISDIKDRTIETSQSEMLKEK